jgi:hypothetical protein
LFDLTGNNQRLTITKRFSWKTKYDITLGDNNILAFRTKSSWKSHYQCQLGSDLFDIYSHKGRKYSVYKNDRQVAWWDQQRVTWFEGDNYKIIADADSDDELLMGFCLIIDNSFSNSNEDNTVTINVGNIGPQARAFDPTWQPKD